MPCGVFQANRLLHRCVLTAHCLPRQGTEGHNTAQIGGFVMLPPVVFANIGAGREAARKAVLTQLGLTHDSAKLAAFASEYAGLLYDLATGVSAANVYRSCGSTVLCHTPIHLLNRFRLFSPHTLSQWMLCAQHCTASYCAVA